MVLITNCFAVILIFKNIIVKNIIQVDFWVFLVIPPKP